MLCRQQHVKYGKHRNVFLLYITYIHTLVGYDIFFRLRTSILINNPQIIRLTLSREILYPLVKMRIKFVQQLLKKLHNDAVKDFDFYQV